MKDHFDSLFCGLLLTAAVAAVACGFCLGGIYILGGCVVGAVFGAMAFIQ